MSHLYSGMAWAFSGAGRSGNPSYLIVSDMDTPGLAQRCQEKAIQHGCEVTWIQLGDHLNSSAQLRFFVSSGEIAFCGHGTLAAASWLAKHGYDDTVLTFQCNTQQVSCHRGGPTSDQWGIGLASVTVKPLLSQADKSDLLTALGLKTQQPAVSVFRTQGAARTKLLIEFEHRHALRNIKLLPDLRDQMCQRLDATGIYAFAFEDSDDINIFARHFPIYAGLAEDMATGGVAPAIAHYAVMRASRPFKHITIHQGGLDCQHALITVYQTDNRGIRDSEWLVSGVCTFSDADYELRKE